MRGDYCHSERSRGIWARSRDTPHSPPDVSTPRCSARHDRQCLAAFTLIELLVVISVIAVLMALLMPALQGVKRKVNAIRCRANLRQWGVAFSLACDDHDGRFLTNPGFYPGWAGVVAHWPRIMRPYCNNGDALYLCPSAARYMTFPWSGVREGVGEPTFRPWNCEGPQIGSYGLNESVPYCYGWQDATAKLRRVYDPGAEQVPVLLDCT